MFFNDIYTVFWRDWLVLHRRMTKFILSRMVTPVLYLVAFGWGLGRGIQMNGGSYLNFIVPGIMALNAMNISFNSVASPLNMMRLYHKSFEEYLVAPVGPAAFVIGKILAGTLRGMISCAVIFLLAHFFGATIAIHAGFLLVLMLICALFAAMGVVAAMVIDSHEDMGNFSTYFLLPMSFLCATFFTVDKFPLVLRWIIEILPLTHATYALRILGAGGHTPWPSVAVLGAYAVILTGAGIWTLLHVRD
ncbi:ABC transporter permease [Methylomusa anaerophila]|uniref:Transport permease protein n=1 Tax=Methylomusa anaerophila TaxID=1930071 RepID=A0A348AEB6_9FIRM|nr:ABC transporter permease [Methylomusa anaerophila]BBB89414.1 inner membrane transport permease YadH [Methylomusa anaerophila]